MRQLRPIRLEVGSLSWPPGPTAGRCRFSGPPGSRTPSGKIGSLPWPTPRPRLSTACATQVTRLGEPAARPEGVRYLGDHGLGDHAAAGDTLRFRQDAEFEEPGDSPAL